MRLYWSDTSDTRWTWTSIRKLPATRKADTFTLCSAGRLTPTDSPCSKNRLLASDDEGGDAISNERQAEVHRPCLPEVSSARRHRGRDEPNDVQVSGVRARVDSARELASTEAGPAPSPCPRIVSR